MGSDDIGLRERKRVAAIWRIQEVALDLFDEHGYDNVTIEQIAEAAEVSPSTVYRYFGTKQQIVLRDELEIELVHMVERELGTYPPVEAVRRAVSGLMSDYFDRDEALSRRRTRYALNEPALWASELAQTDQFVGMLATTLARISGRDEIELEDRVIASALMWSLVAAVRHWHDNGYRSSLREDMERALALVEKGLGTA
jgi:AcrR family transcriptional regulator